MIYRNINENIWKSSDKVGMAVILWAKIELWVYGESDMELPGRSHRQN